MSEQEVKTAKAEEIDIIAKYNEFIEHIPWAGLKSLPQKLKKYASFLGIDNVDDIDLVPPLQEIISFIGVLVKRLRRSEKKFDRLEARHADLEARVAALEDILQKELQMLQKKSS